MLTCRLLTKGFFREGAIDSTFIDSYSHFPVPTSLDQLLYTNVTRYTIDGIITDIIVKKGVLLFMCHD